LPSQGIEEIGGRGLQAAEAAPQTKCAWGRLAPCTMRTVDTQHGEGAGCTVVECKASPTPNRNRNRNRNLCVRLCVVEMRKITIKITITSRGACFALIHWRSTPTLSPRGGPSRELWRGAREGSLPRSGSVRRMASTRCPAAFDLKCQRCERRVSCSAQPNPRPSPVLPRPAPDSGFHLSVRGEGRGEGRCDLRFEI
jgi:hypothetical protein